MGRIEAFLGGYSENFAVALAAWPFFSFTLTLRTDVDGGSPVSRRVLSRFLDVSLTLS